MSRQSQFSPAPYRLYGRSLLMGRLFYTLMLLLCISMFALSLSYKFVKGTSACDTVYNESWGIYCYNWFEAMTNLGLTAVAFESYFLILRLIAALPFFILSLILIWRHGSELRVLLFATLLLVMGIAGTWFNPFWEWANGWFELYAYPSLTMLSRVLTYCLLGGSLVFVCLFPNGRFVPRWSRWLAGSWLLLLAGNIFFYDTNISWNNWPAPLNTSVPLVFIGLGVAVVVTRYQRQATAVHRQQIKWITLGLLLTALNLMLDFSVFVIYPALTNQDLITTGRQAVLWELSQDTLSHISQFLLGICFIIAIFRHRLWDIDIIVRKTLQYSIVSGMLAAVYFGSITLIQGGITAVAQTESPLAIVLSTLLIAALFNPLRQRVQTFVDRRFYRQKYDAQQILAQFAQTARDEVEMEALQTELLRVVQETMQPETVSIWLKR